ncbi:hypothetical protein HYALB_00012978 [Hymenoscyphus albidus]|uniref:Rhodopsin domain-containing protein n=1 Tax=Hymenoscyphus albidus TaxID=595503 RepID=A0A9N9LTJ1_9HELO|nr:hypothetical protein HYALB_00012978 [Hymenoscyphus albidus]
MATVQQVALDLTESRGPDILVISWIFTILTVIVVSLKLFTRASILNALAIDDFFIFVSAVSIIICTSVFTYDVKLGMGKHAAALPIAQVSHAVKVNLIANPFGIMAYSFPNISVAILINRILAPNKIRSILLYFLVITQVLSAAVSCVILFVQCLPSEFIWNPDPALNPTCLAPGVVSGYSYFVGSYAAATDIILGVVPMVAFWKLKLDMRTKTGLCLMMGCTLFAAICAAIKTSHLGSLEQLNDFTYATVDLVIWAIVEANVIIIAACIPTLRPFFHKFFKHSDVTEGRSFFWSGSFFKIGSKNKYSFGSNGSWGRKEKSSVSQSHSEGLDTKDLPDIELQNEPRQNAESHLQILRTTQFSMDSTTRENMDYAASFKNERTSKSMV